MITLESSVTRFLIEDSDETVGNIGVEAEVDLFSMLHVADQDYYSLVNDRLKQGNYDVVLYELITSKENIDCEDFDKDLFDSPFKKR